LARLNEGFLALGRRLDELGRLASLGATILGQTSPTSLAQVDELRQFFELVVVVPVSQAYTLRRFAVLRESEQSKALEIALQGKALQDSITASEPLFVPAAFEADTASVRSDLARAAVSWFARLGARYRCASAELSTWLKGALPKRAAERIALVDALRELKIQKDALAARELEGALLLGPLWAGQDS
jgi:hypothetical protein